MIHCKDVSFSYRLKDGPILKDVTFHVKPQKITILLGNNGSGKTTLLNCIDGVNDVVIGTIDTTVDAILITDHPHLYEYLTGREYLDIISTLKGDDLSDQMNRLTDELGLTETFDKLIIDYSLGMKHKLAIVASLALGYQLYLIDEPLTALDPDSQRFMINYFKKLRLEGNTFLISTHMMYVAYELADDILILHDGGIHQVENQFDSFALFEDYVLNRLRLPIEKEGQ